MAEDKGSKQGDKTPESGVGEPKPETERTENKTGGNTQWERLVREAAVKIAAVAGSVGGLVAFVAAVGGAIVWTRFDAAQLPADQALDAMPQGELIATGAITVAAFAVLGVVAAAGVFLIDHGGSKEQRTTRGLSRGLLVLVAVEAITLSAFAIGDVGDGFRRWLVSFEAILLLLLLSLLITRAPTLWTALHPGDDADDEAGTPTSDTPALEAIDRRTWIFIGAWTLAAGVVIAARHDASNTSSWIEVTIIALAGLIVVPGVVFGLRWLEDDKERQSPDGLYLRRPGGVALIVLAIGVVAIPSLVMQQWWLAVALATATLMGIAAWRTASVTERNFLWYGAVVFASVPLIGAVAAIAANIADPQVQPLALIRNGDSEREAMQGIYVTETDDYVYFASVAAKDCSGDPVPGSGTMTKVPRDEVVAMTLGPRQSIEDAGQRALEMYHTLAPAAWNPPVLTVNSGKAPDADSEPRRLEDPGPALRREFGGSLRLDETAARPGDLVTIRGEGFGASSENKTIRVNGIPAKIAERTPLDPQAGPVGQDENFHWNRWAVRFIVPKGATSGPVTVECGRTAIPPRLRVQRLPRARIDLQLVKPDGRIKLTSRRSSDTGGAIVRRQWQIGSRGWVSGKTLVRDFSARSAPYEIALKVVDDENDRDTATVKLWRLKFDGDAASFMARHEVALNAIAAELERQPTAHLFVHAQLHVPGLARTRATNGKRPLPPVLALARNIVEQARGNEKQRKGEHHLIRTFANSCPMAVADGERANGHVDIFVVDPGSQPLPVRCATLHVE